MEASAVWHFLGGAPGWASGVAAGLLAVLVAAALLVVMVRRRATADLPPFDENDSTLDDDEAATGFRSSRFAARVCSTCSQPMLLEGDGRWRCAGYPACRG